MKKVFLFLILLMSFAAISQNINDYQYVIVPKKFDFLKEENKYGLNISVKFLLQKYGFKAYFNDDPFFDDKVSSRCDFLTADLINESGLLITKVRIVLKDCKNNIVYQSEVGGSRDKQYTIAYNQALREASKSFEQLHYKYNGTNEVAVETVTPLSQPIVPETATPTPSSAATTTAEAFFFAQPIANGYQVVNNEPRVIMRLLMTSQKNVFIGIKDNLQGVVLFKNNQWFFEYYENGKLVSELLKLKF